MMITIAHWVELKKHVSCTPWTWLYNYWLVVVPVKNWDPVVSCAFQRDDTDCSCSEEIWGSIHILHWSSPLFSERSSSCSWTSKHTLLCYASSPEGDYMPSRLWCIGIPKLHQRPVAQKSGMSGGEAEVCNGEWKVPSYRSSHTGDT